MIDRQINLDKMKHQLTAKQICPSDKLFPIFYLYTRIKFPKMNIIWSFHFIQKVLMQNSKTSMLSKPC